MKTLLEILVIGVMIVSAVFGQTETQEEAVKRFLENHHIDNNFLGVDEFLHQPPGAPILPFLVNQDYQLPFSPGFGLVKSEGLKVSMRVRIKSTEVFLNPEAAAIAVKTMDEKKNGLGFKLFFSFNEVAPAFAMEMILDSEANTLIGTGVGSDFQGFFFMKRWKTKNGEFRLAATFPPNSISFSYALALK